MKWTFSDNYFINGLYIPKGTPIDEITKTGIIKFKLNGVEHQIQT